MAHHDISWAGFGLRLLFAVALVFLTYNPAGYSFYHWVLQGGNSALPLKVFSAVLLIIGWTIYLRATKNSLSFFGLLLASAFFASLIWLLIDWGVFRIDSSHMITYLVMIGLSLILAIGLYWSHIRRRLSGQLDVDETAQH